MAGLVIAVLTILGSNIAGIIIAHQQRSGFITGFSAKNDLWVISSFLPSSLFDPRISSFSSSPFLSPRPHFPSCSSLPFPLMPPFSSRHPSLSPCSSPPSFLLLFLSLFLWLYFPSPFPLSLFLYFSAHCLLSIHHSCFTCHVTVMIFCFTASVTVQ